MKFLKPALSILFCCWLLVGCESLGIRDPFLYDQVPPDVKAEPRLVALPPPVSQTTPWPRLGDVPFKPHDFSTKPVYDHYMSELEFDRAESQTARTQLESESPALPADAALPQGALLAPPQLPKE